ncbi:hypothetical protein IT407_04590 [Candidatus Uhrbacteria bacterium]|nr:hypothetical protein [Candidatus Uhrbacteria bacterium]
MSRMDRFRSTGGDKKPAEAPKKQATVAFGSGTSAGESQSETSVREQPGPSKAEVEEVLASGPQPDPMAEQKRAFIVEHEFRLEKADAFLQIDANAFDIGREEAVALIDSLREDAQHSLLGEAQRSHAAERAAKLMRKHDEVYRKTTLVKLAASNGVPNAESKPLSDIARILSGKLDDEAKKGIELELHRAALYTEDGKKEIARLTALLAEPKKAPSVPPQVIIPPAPNSGPVDTAAPTLTPIPDAPKPTGQQTVTMSIGQVLAHHSVIAPFDHWVKDKSDDVLAKVKTDIGHATYDGKGDAKVQQAMVAAIDNELRAREEKRAAKEKETMDAPQTPQNPPTPPPQSTPEPKKREQLRVDPQDAQPGPKKPGEVTMFQQKLAPPWYKRPLTYMVGAVLAMLVALLVYKIGESYEHGRAHRTATADRTTVPDTSDTGTTETDETVAETDESDEEGGSEASTDRTGGLEGFTCIPASAHGDCSAVSLTENTVTLTEDRRAVAHWDCSGVNHSVLWEHMNGPRLNACDLCRWCEPRADD